MSIIKIAAKKEKKDLWRSGKRGALYGAGIGAIALPSIQLAHFVLRGQKLKELANPASTILKSMAYGATTGAALGGLGSLLKDQLSDEAKKSG